MKYQHSIKINNESIITLHQNSLNLIGKTMSPLRTYLNDYIQTVQTLQAQYANSQDVLKAAETKWGDNDPRYVILLEMRLTEVPDAAATKWNTPSDEPTQDADTPEAQPNELIDWLPIGMESLQNLLANGTDDAALLEKAKKWGPDSNGYLLVTVYNGSEE